ncbi:hypothetical protein RND81_09G055600 [Saponaria officinalis]|uniref:Uncharacterized protein n=1 Tax=Saponaria officinalis TaxID=3572 RepID=A0AAW1IJ62_SAPOF
MTGISREVRNAVVRLSLIVRKIADYEDLTRRYILYLASARSVRREAFIRGMTDNVQALDEDYNQALTRLHSIIQETEALNLKKREIEETIFFFENTPRGRGNHLLDVIN